MRHVLWVALLLGAVPIEAAWAAGAAVQAFEAGRFQEAIAAGRKENSAPALIAAGRAGSTVAAFQTTDRKRARELLLAAETDFDAALALQPGNPEALLQKAIAIGYRAKLENNIGLAKQARRNFEALLAKRPNDALVLGALGGWHGEAIATLGKFIAGTALGANAKDGARYYDKAVASPGADPVVPIFYATTLLNLSADNAPKAKALLQRAVKAPPADGFERLMVQNGRAILAPLEKGDVEAAQEAAKRVGPFGSLR